MNPAADVKEAALRRLPPQYSLALRLRAARVADVVICEYLGIECEGLDVLLEIAEDKLASAIAIQADEPG